MRSYPCNSPHAAARIVALTLFSDGALHPTELAMLDAIHVQEQHDLTRQEWHDVVHEFCADLLASATPGTDCHIDSRMIDRMLADVDDLTLQRLVLCLCTAVISADRQVDEGESIVLRAAMNRWGLHPDEQEFLDHLLYGLDFQVIPCRARFF